MKTLVQGDWVRDGWKVREKESGAIVCETYPWDVTGCKEEDVDVVCLIVASPKLYSEMERYLPILERLAACPKLWVQLTEGTGIATLNGYKHAMSLARNEITPNP